MAQQVERRSTQRQRSYLAGHIVLNKRFSTIDCVVRDISPDGAKIEVSDTIPLPGTFELIVRHRGDSRCARLIWHDQNRIGVVFDAVKEASVNSIDAARKLSGLEQERDRLARRIAQLSEPA